MARKKRGKFFFFTLLSSLACLFMASLAPRRGWRNIAQQGKKTFRVLYSWKNARDDAPEMSIRMDAEK